MTTDRGRRRGGIGKQRCRSEAWKGSRGALFISCHCRRVGWGARLRGEDGDVDGDGGLLGVDDVAPVEVVLGLGLSVPPFGVFLEKRLVEQDVVVAGYENPEGVWLRVEPVDARIDFGSLSWTCGRGRLSGRGSSTRCSWCWEAGSWDCGACLGSHLLSSQKGCLGRPSWGHRQASLGTCHPPWCRHGGSR